MPSAGVSSTSEGDAWGESLGGPDDEPSRRLVAIAFATVISGGALMMVGSTMPWFVVGPASRIGLADDGWLCLLAGALVVAAGLVMRFAEGRDLRSAVFGACGVAVLSVIVALATPPEAMSTSSGSFVCLFGAALAAAGVWQSGRAQPGTENDDGSDAAHSRSRHGAAWTALRVVGWMASVVALSLLTLACWPVDIGDLGAEPEPTSEYAAAVERFAVVTTDEEDLVYGPCRSRLYDHGEPTDVVVVLFHGLTNCPRQYQEMAESIHRDGANVLVLRAPGHGLANDEGDEITGAGALHNLTAGQLADYADDAIDIAAGLGDQVRVHGLSMGGVISLWVAQHRVEVERVVAMAPAFEIPVVPNAVTNWFTNVFARTPSITLSHERRIDHDYSGFSTRGLAASFTLGQAVMADGLDVGPVVDDVTVILNPDDPLVTEADIIAMIDAWDRHEELVDVTILDTDGLPHDAIDVGQPDADPDAVYPVVLDALGFTWTGITSP